MDAQNLVNGDIDMEQAEGDTLQYLTFMLDGEEYGVEILRVQGIHGWDRATPIPNAPKHILGVINLRGEIISIIDLRQMFSLESLPFGPTTVVIIVRITHDTSERTVGMVVDAVSEVYRLARNAIQPPPDFGTAVNVEFVQGLATVDEKMLILLDVDHLVNDGLFAGIDAAVEASDAA